MSHFLDFGINLQALGIGWGTLLMFVMMVGLLLSGMPLAFVTLLVALIFALVNTIIGTVIKVIAFPLYILTFGLIALIVNGFLLWLTAWITSGFGWGLTVGNFWWGIVAALLIAIINGIFGFILRPQNKRRD